MKPILFSTPMVQAVLAGRKTQTRRVIKPQPHECAVAAVDLTVCARYQPGDILWVRETWAHIPETTPGNMHYKASATNADLDWFKENGWKWRPSIHMPREAARIFLRVTGVRVERVQDISEADAKAEGVVFGKGQRRWTARSAFMDLWDEINAKRGYSWESNPWVFVYEFERTEKPEG